MGKNEGYHGKGVLSNLINQKYYKNAVSIIHINNINNSYYLSTHCVLSIFHVSHI